MATIKTTTPALPDYITYRFANRLVYVRPAQTYEIALDIAQKEFVELAHMARDRISFNTVTTINRQELQVVRISESAWFVAMARQLCGGVIDIILTPDRNAPPTCLAVPAETTKKGIDMLHGSRSTPPSPVNSRQFPLGQSAKSAKIAKRSWLPRLGVQWPPFTHHDAAACRFSILTNKVVQH